MALSHILPAFLVLAFSQQGQLPPADEVTAEALHELGGFLEGIVFGDDGTAYVSDVPGGVVYRFGPGTEPEVWATSEAPNGHKILEDGTHILADMDDRAVLRFSSSGSPIEPSIDTSEGDPLLRPNDIALDGGGGFYFTDPGIGLVEGSTGSVHYSGPDLDPWTVASGLAFPNGIVLSPNGGTLYVSESLTNQIISIQILTRGLLGRRQLFVDLSSEVTPLADGLLDGITVDGDGNVYVAVHGDGRIFVISPEGEVLRRYDAGMVSVANLAFSPAEPGRLFVVGSRDAERTEGLVTVIDLPGAEAVSR